MPHSVSPSPTVCSRARPAPAGRLPDVAEDDGRAAVPALAGVRVPDAAVRPLPDSVRVPLAAVPDRRLLESARALLADAPERRLLESARAVEAVDEPEAARGMRSVWPRRMVSVSISLAARTASTVTS